MIVAHKTGTLLAVNHYYPFGLRWNGHGSQFHKYQFGGKEYEEELNLNTYDFHARQMDAVLGRFWGVDPMSSERVSFSPFNYVQNNPMNRVDPSGMLDFEMNEYGDKISARSYSRAQSRLRGGFGSDEEVETMYQYENQSVLETQTTVGDGDPTKKVADGLSTTVGIAGTGVGVAEVSTLAGWCQYKTSKGLVRDIDYLKLTKNSKPFANMAKDLNSLNRFTNFLSIGLDAYSWRNNQMSGEKFGLNTAITSYGMWLGSVNLAVPAFVGGALYFSVDSFYPGGWDGAIKKMGDLQNQNRKIIPGFNLHRD